MTRAIQIALRSRLIPMIADIYRHAYAPAIPVYGSLLDAMHSMVTIAFSRFLGDSVDVLGFPLDAEGLLTTSDTRSRSCLCSYG